MCDKKAVYEELDYPPYGGYPWAEGQDSDEDEEFDDEDDYASNMPCDTYGLCAGSGCSRYHSGECDGY